MTLSYVTRIFFLVLCFSAQFPPTSFSAEIECILSERSGFDDGGIHIEPFVKEPQEKLILPQIEAKQKWFMRIGIPDRTPEDRSATAMIITKDNGDLIYVDRNNDEDLTNDGKPIFFPLDENDFWLFIPSTADPDAKLGTLYQREPKSPSCRPDLRSKIYRNGFMDDQGNVAPTIVQLLARKKYPDFEGKPRTFYFDESLPLSRGEIVISGARYQIALYDQNFNGRFNDPQDRLVVDINGDGGIYRKVLNETFKLTDVFPIGIKHYKLSEIDPYGQHLQIIETTENPTSLFHTKETKTKKPDELAEKKIRRIRTRKGKLNSDFWNLQFETIDGKPIQLADYKGLYLVLNFWGEWCAPCIEEIPILVKARQEYSGSKMVLISMLNTRNLGKARQMIHNHEMTWPQIQQNGAISNLFRVSSYPTNILIMPDGETYQEQGHINYKFFEENIK